MILLCLFKKKCELTDMRCTGNTMSRHTRGRIPLSIRTFKKARAGDLTWSLNDSAYCPQIKTRYIGNLREILRG